MAQTAIKAVALSKRYRIPVSRTDDAPSPDVPGFEGPPKQSRGRVPDRWINAVDHLTFEIDAGEAVGLIGRNGAGKSTLLKLLSRVTRPTSGHADLYGRVGALLEVGTGFHPELTGRENTFLSGAILGMSKRDIKASFDEIVAFAEIEPFIDMPVKRYSSGMYARLGFAVAAFLKPAILIVDEILAVGDLSYQAKCLAHMRGLSKDGTTVLFVSHNLLGMADFCPRALVIADGRLMFDGPTSEAIALYRRALTVPPVPEIRGPSQPVYHVEINGQPAVETIESQPNDPLRVGLEVDAPVGSQPVDIELNLVIETADGQIAVHLRNDIDGTALGIGPGRNTLTLDVEDLALAPGNYTLWLRVVSLFGAKPIIWDTDRFPLIVAGDQRLTSIMRPRHRFRRLADADNDRPGGAPPP
jgi:lipopolysaccharide transport system ATP-binding protein